MGFLCKWLKTWSPQFKMQKHHVTGRLKQELPYFGANSDPHDQAGGWRCRGWRLKFDVFLVSSQKLHGMHTFWMKLTQISARCSKRPNQWKPLQAKHVKMEAMYCCLTAFFHVSSQKLHDSYTETAPKYGRSKQGILRMNVLAYRVLLQKILLDSR